MCKWFERSSHLHIFFALINHLTAYTSPFAHFPHQYIFCPRINHILTAYTSTFPSSAHRISILAHYLVGLPPHMVPSVIAGIKMGIRCKSGTIPVAVILHSNNESLNFPGQRKPLFRSHGMGRQPGKQESQKTCQV